MIKPENCLSETQRSYPDILFGAVAERLRHRSQKVSSSSPRVEVTSQC